MKEDKVKFEDIMTLIYPETGDTYVVELRKDKEGNVIKDNRDKKLYFFIDSRDKEGNFIPLANDNINIYRLKNISDGYDENGNLILKSNFLTVPYIVDYDGTRKYFGKKDGDEENFYLIDPETREIKDENYKFKCNSITSFKSIKQNYNEKKKKNPNYSFKEYIDNVVGKGRGFEKHQNKGFKIGNFKFIKGSSLYNDYVIIRYDDNGEEIEQKDVDKNLVIRIYNLKDDEIAMEKIKNSKTIDDIAKAFPSKHEKAEINKEKRYQETYKKLKDAYSDDFDEEFGGSKKPSMKDMLDFERNHQNINNKGRELEQIVADTLDKNLDPQQNDELKTNEKEKTSRATQTGRNPDLSDIEVTLKNKDKFFIEVKLDYDSAPITHLGVEIKNGTLNILKNNRVDNKLHGDDKNILDNFVKSINSKEENSLTQIVQKSEQLKKFYRRYNNFVQNLENKDFNLPFQKGRIKFENDATFPQKFQQMASECQRFITYYETQYKELLTTFSKLNVKKDKDEQEQIIKTIQDKFPLNEMTDDDSLKNDKDIIEFISDIEDRDHAINILINIRKIHNKLTIILNDAGKNSLESLTEADKAKFIFWTFLAISRNDRIKKDEIVLFDKVIDQTDYARRLAKIEVTDKTDLNTIGEMISRYYRGLGDVAYVQIGNDTYYLDKKFDPLNIITNNNLQDIRQSFSKAVIVLNLNENLTKIKMVINLYPIKGNEKYFGFFGDENSDKQIKDIDLTKNEKINENYQELKEAITKVLKEEENVEEGIKTSETEANKFELEVTEKMKQFFSVQQEPYKSLKVEHYEGSDLKYWPDTSVTNPINGKRVWVEIKLDKFANLGSSSWKFQDGKWTCSTLEENSPILQILQKAIEENSSKFIQFCREYLKKDDIKLPTDLTVDLIEAWKKSGNIEDTENDVQFITDKIYLENFGDMVAKFYTYSKNEAAYYMQVGDSLYILNPKYNIFNFRTKDNLPLKSLAEVYKKGRIQFRAKGLKKEQKYYYNIYCDVKIIFDEDNIEENYNCSFLTEDKWPLIVQDENSESYKDNEQEIKEFLEQLYEEDKENIEFITNIKEETIKNILDIVKIENSRYNRSQFTKYFGIKDINWCALVKDKDCFAIAAILNNNPFKDYYYIDEIQTLKKGYGKILLNNIIEKYQKVWLMANTAAGETLIEYYRKTGLEEIEVPQSVYGCTAYFFCTKKCEYDKLHDYIIAFYSEEDGEESIEENSLFQEQEEIGGEKSEVSDEISGLKIWIDDIREAPEGFKWLKSVRDFISFVSENGIENIELIDTDHDAGDYQKFGGDYIRCFDYLDYIGAKNIIVHIHSANPVGANNIRRIISKNKEENGWKEIRNSKK